MLVSSHIENLQSSVQNHRKKDLIVFHIRKHVLIKLLPTNRYHANNVCTQLIFKFWFKIKQIKSYIFSTLSLGVFKHQCKIIKSILNLILRCLKLALAFSKITDQSILLFLFLNFIVRIRSNKLFIKIGFMYSTIY